MPETVSVPPPEGDGTPIDQPPKKPIIYAAYAVTAASTVYVAKAIHDWIFCACITGI